MTREDLAEIAALAGSIELPDDAMLAAAERQSLAKLVLELHQRHAIRLGMTVAEIQRNLLKVPLLRRRPSPFTRDREEMEA